MKAPRTVVTMACRTENPILLCAGSMTHSPVRPASAGSGTTAAEEREGLAEGSDRTGDAERRGEEPRLNRFMIHLITAPEMAQASPRQKPGFR
ncbi:hypothetical protein ALMP_80100 [Streptomyces sp. A012304]|nr:hypothetical protein ALMP_80100 [Streptomyces sp. A012304]